MLHSMQYTLKQANHIENESVITQIYHQFRNAYASTIVHDTLCHRSIYGALGHPNEFGPKCHKPFVILHLIDQQWPYYLQYDRLIKTTYSTYVHPEF